MSLEQVDLLFPITGKSKLAADHSYSLYAALSNSSRIPGLHDAHDIGVFPIANLERLGDGRARLGTHSRLRMRLPASQLSNVVHLAGQTLNVDGAQLRVGAPRVLPLQPASVLRSGLVLIKSAGNSGNELTAERFLDAARRQLVEQQIGGQPGIPTHPTGPEAGQPIRRVRRLKGHSLVGYPLLVDGLTADESIRLQVQGLGGKRKMGCGLFLPASESKGTP